MSNHRFFRASPEVYELIRAQVDAAWGLPEPLTETCILPAEDQRQDAGGNCLLAVRLEWLEWEPVATLLPQMLDIDAVEELTEAEYWAAIASPD